MQSLMDVGSSGAAGGLGFWLTILIGGLAGWLAEKITKTNMGIFMNIIVGIIGAWIGAKLADALNLHLGEIFQGWFWGNLIVATAGAVILLYVVRLIRGRRTTE